MKVYSKPIVNADVIDGINEPVFLISGDNWSMADCYVSRLYNAQIPEIGRNSIIMQIDAIHFSDDEDYAGTPFGHHNHHQYFIFKFKRPIETAGLTGFINGMPLEFSPDGAKCRCIHFYHQNATDAIGAGDWTMTLFHDGTQLSGNELMPYIPISFQCADIGFRCTHSVCETYDFPQ